MGVAQGAHQYLAKFFPCSPRIVVYGSNYENQRFTPGD